MFSVFAHLEVTQAQVAPLGGCCGLVGRGAAALVEGIGGVLGGAGHHVAVDPAVQLNHRGLGGHRGVAGVR